MGSTWEVTIWKWFEWQDQYGDESFWRGESWLKAAWYLLKAHREGHGCVTLHWRRMPND